MSFKALLSNFLILTTVALLISGCEKEANLEKPGMMWVGNSPSAQTQKPLYDVKLETKMKNKNGTYTWIWSVSNINPGSGKPGSGTAQDLQSWGITMGSCADINQILQGSTSPDGIVWTNFNPEVKSDVNVVSNSKPLVMFNLGTTKNQKSYYKLVVLRNFDTNKVTTAVYQSGSVTGSGLLTTTGFGCPI